MKVQGRVAGYVQEEMTETRQYNRQAAAMWNLECEVCRMKFRREGRKSGSISGIDTHAVELNIGCAGHDQKYHISAISGAKTANVCK